MEEKKCQSLVTVATETVTDVPVVHENVPQHIIILTCARESFAFLSRPAQTLEVTSGSHYTVGKIFVLDVKHGPTETRFLSCFSTAVWEI